MGWAFGNYDNASDTDVRMNFSGISGKRVEIKKISANDDQWHHIVGTYDRDGNMTVYMDGEKYSSVSMAEHSGKTVDAGFDFVLGGDGRGCYGMSRCMVDELRVYNKVLADSAVKTIYEAEGAMLTPGWGFEFWSPVAVASIITIVLYVVGQTLGDASDPRTHM